MEAFVFSGFNLFLFLFTAFLIYNYYKSKKRHSNSPPIVFGSLPFIGHGLYFIFFPLHFLRLCYKIYGPVFTIKLFRLKIALVGDPSLVQEIYKAGENELSAYSVINDHFTFTFSENLDFNKHVGILVKKSLSGLDGLKPQLESAALQMMSRIRTLLEEGKSVKLLEETERFASFSVFASLINRELSEESFEAFKAFAKTANLAAILTFAFPTSWVKTALGNRLKKLRKNFSKSLNLPYTNWREGKEVVSSSFLKAALETPYNGAKASDEEISTFVLNLIYGSYANTGIALANLLLDLGSNEGALERAQQSKEYLNNAILETARMSTQTFLVNRSPKQRSQLGSWFIGDVDQLAICPPLLQMYGKEVDNIFPNPNSYDPDRFLKEPSSSKSITTWSGGRHLCPGRALAIMEMEIAATTFISQFKFEEKPKNLGIDFSAPSALGCKIGAKIVKLGLRTK